MLDGQPARQNIISFCFCYTRSHRYLDQYPATTTPNNIPKKTTDQIMTAGTSSSDKTVNTYKIILVDDDPDILLTFKKGLEEVQNTIVEGVNLQVDTFADPKEALASFKAGVYEFAAT